MSPVVNRTSGRRDPSGSVVDFQYSERIAIARQFRPSFWENSVQASVEDEDEDAGGEISSEVEFEEGREAKISEVRVIV